MPYFAHLCRSQLAAVISAVSLSMASAAFADQHTAGTPQLSSLPGAAYTIYLDFAGFNYAGDWAGKTPGSSAAYNDVAASGTFSAQEISDIKATWAGVAAQYAAFNINVTTVDPASGANAATDLARQTYYANTPNMMHTVVTSQNHGGTDWFGTGIAGVSFQGVTNGTQSYEGGHTNWIFTGGTTYNEVGNVHYLVQDTTHENGHALGLGHQSDYVGTTLVNDYGIGDNNAGGSTTGPGTYSGIMGDGNAAQRLTWKVGNTSEETPGPVQNDVARIIATNTVANALGQGRTGGVDLHFKEDGIGHTLLTATALPLLGNGTVDFSLATGVIVPKSETNPQPIGAENYTQDWFSFTLTADSAITLTAHDGSQFLTAGVADSESPLRSTLSIYDSVGGLLGSALEDSSTLFETYTGTLGAGTYFASIGSFGGHAQVNAPGTNFNATSNFDMGGYFVTGTGFNVVPEPGTMGLATFGLLIVGARRRRREAARN